MELVGQSFSVNSFIVTATLAEVKALRYTPAGLPALDLELIHQSEVSDQGKSRQVGLQLRAVAFGVMAEKLRNQAVGSEWQFSGFMAAAKAKPTLSKQIVFHIQDFQTVPKLPVQ